MSAARTARSTIVAAAAVAFCLACSCAPKPTWEDGDASAAIEVFSTATDAELKLGSDSAQAAAPQAVELPESFDLRDRGVVTPVKTQNPWGTCWSFSAIAAAETSALSAAGQTYDETGIDLSELHLAWFPFIPVSEKESASQAGEGLYLLSDDGAEGYDAETGDVNAPLRYGAGYGPMISSLFASGGGPATEDQFPYQGSSGMTTYDYYVAYPDAAKELVREDIERNEKMSFEDYASTYYPGASIDDVLEWEYQAYTQFYATENCYASEDDWSIATENEDGQLNRFACSALELVDANYLPQLCQRDEGVWTDLNENGMRAAKEELLAGRGVTVCLAADQARPEDPTGDNYINTDTWAHYTYEDVPINHEVCIVGWDDSYSWENFNADTPPPGDGAWIAKNSWGSEDGAPGDIGWSPWGVADENGLHTGFFYISYYDKSLTDPITFAFAPQDAPSGQESAGETAIEQYDFLPGIGGFYRLSSSGVLREANVFTASQDEEIYAVSAMTPAANTHVRFDVVLLDDEQASIDDGTLAASIWQRFDRTGYHRIDLPKPVSVKKGQRFAVVCTSFKPDDKGNRRYMVCAGMDDGRDKVLEEAEASGETPEFYAYAVVNPGESYLYENDAWTDWTEHLAGLGESYKDTEIDNFGIKAYARV